MKIYNVQEVATILQTKPETVRRWIRQGKLQASQTSRKAGNEITEEALSEFIAQREKEAKKAIAIGSASLTVTSVAAATATATALGVPGVGAAVAIINTVLGTFAALAVKKADAKKQKPDVDHTSEEVIIMIEDRRHLLRDKIRMLKEKQIELQTEISELENQFNQLTDCLNNKDAVKNAVQREFALQEILTESNMTSSTDDSSET